MEVLIRNVETDYTLLTRFFLGEPSRHSEEFPEVHIQYLVP